MPYQGFDLKEFYFVKNMGEGWNLLSGSTIWTLQNEIQEGWRSVSGILLGGKCLLNCRVLEIWPQHRMETWLQQKQQPARVCCRAAPCPSSYTTHSELHQRKLPGWWKHSKHRMKGAEVVWAAGKLQEQSSYETSWVLRTRVLCYLWGPRPLAREGFVTLDIYLGGK